MQNDAPNDRRETSVSGETEATLRPGEMFAERYRLEERVGSGGMGLLFRAVDTRLQRRVALKVLRRDRDGAQDASPGEAQGTRGGTANPLSEASARILREARAAAALNHPNVVAIHDVGERDGVPFIAMEYVKGKSLRCFVGAPEPSFDARLEWMIDVARALAAAHDRGLVHRDVKPDNVMIREDGMVKVLDFGIARQQRTVPDSNTDLRTFPGTNESGERGTGDVTVSRVLGTPGYMAPEQIRGEACDGRADQFAWGVMAYELFSGALPWSPEHGTFYVMTAVLTEEVKPLSNIPFHVSRAILRALEKKPENRFATMAELVTALGARTPSRLETLIVHDVSSLLQATTGEAQMVDPALVQRDAPTTRKMKRPAGGVPSRGLIAGALLVLAIAGFVVMRSTGMGGAREGEGPPPKTPGPVESAVAMTVLRTSPTCSKAAEATFREGVASMHEATWELALPTFEKAVAEDPACPEPQLQLLITAYFRYSIAQEREQYHRVNSMRDGLSERDGTLLDAFAPLVASEPADREESARRFAAAVERFPQDPQMLTLASMVRSFGAHDAAAVEQSLDFARRATAIDPKNADGWQHQEVALVRLGRIDEGMAALDKCLDVAPGSGDCLEDRIRILRLRGQCAAASGAARRWIASVPTSSSAYRHLANALASEGAPEETVDAVLEQFRAHLDAETRETAYLLARGRLSAAVGDFAAAEKWTEQLEGLWKNSPNVWDHVRAAAILMELATETGKPARAATIAEQFFRRRDAWTEGFWSTTSYEPLLLASLLQRGAISHEKWRTLTDLWEKSAASTVSRTWALRWGPVSSNRKMALDAWRVRPPPGPAAGSLEQPMSLRTLSDGFEGRVALMAGEPAQAVEILEAASKSCDRLEEPFATARAHLWLGEAKEANGDVAGACAAYDDVLKQWGDAKPRSVTADEARQRRQALGCK